MRMLKVWWHILSSAGTGMRAGRQADQLFRYYVFKTLEDLGFFDYLREPRSYGEILAHFGFVDGPYTRELVDTLVNDKPNLISQNRECYTVNAEIERPRLEEVLRKTDRRIRPFVMMAEGMSRNILDRLQAEDVGFAEVMEREDYDLLSKFNTVLGSEIYSSMRSAAFAYLGREHFEWLRGKHLLDSGCGSGRETAEIWLKFDGQIKITAIDPVPSMIQLARENFETYLDELDPGHPPLTDENRPIFKVASATRLDFPDNSFDACFWLFILHWTSDPRGVIHETVRVVRPGGLIFGGQPFKPEANPYFNLVIRSSRNSHGFFWREEYRHWWSEVGLQIDLATPAGMFRAINTP
ncbi:MAG: class I SAM-dependent methyltransferase [Anaerolineales bacterium]|nr:MAG: class I SAM-dependent methyltransferase [Anaerolineales bacterium]